MKNVSIFRRGASAITAISLVLIFYGFTQVRDLDHSQRAELSSRFRFARAPIAEPYQAAYRTIRTVHPSLKRIEAWISSTGAAVALADLDADGFPNDICHVDPRTDKVTVSPAPGTGDRYKPFELDPSPLSYNAKTMAPMGCIAADLNEDGLMDLLVYYWGRTPVAFLRNAGAPGRKTALNSSLYTPIDVDPTGERWYTNAAFVADLDGDGHLDIVFGNYFHDGARILDASASGVENMHNTKSRSFNGGSKRFLLFRHATAAPRPTVNFTDVRDVLPPEADHSWTLAAGAADLDGDLLPEIYFANDFGPDRLLHNRSTPGHLKFALLEAKRGFTTPASCVLGRDSFKGMGVDFADVNGDGLPDIYVSNIADKYALQESHFLWLSTGRIEAMKNGVAPYESGNEQAGLSRSGWGWDVRLADFDNDGVLEAIQATGFVKGTKNRWPELQALGTGNDQLMSNPNNWPAFRAGDDLSGQDTDAFFVRGRDSRFYDVGAQVGLDEPMVTRGIAIADIDGDGRLDFALANQWQTSYVYFNKSDRAKSFLGLHLLLPLERGSTQARSGHPSVDTPGRPAIGAQATVLVPGGRKAVAQVDGGAGHSGKKSPDLHFGLGDVAAGTNLAVELRWRDPSGRVHTQNINLTPGWHTVILGWPTQGA